MMATATRPEPREKAAEVEAVAPVTSPIPPLRNGDHLTRPEFERRYVAMPDLKKAELIDGVVYIPSPDFPNSQGTDASMASPVSFVHHSSPHFDMISWLGLYRAVTPGVRGGDNSSIRLDIKSMPQPDVLLLILPSYGGQARIDEDDFVRGAPELVAEISFSSASYDLHPKLDIYLRNGTKEYLVWRAEDRTIDWFVAREGRFERLETTPEGWYQSPSFPGLWLDPAALVRGDMVEVFRVAQGGLATPEHAAFVARLRQQAAAPPPQPAPAP